MKGCLDKSTGQEVTVNHRENTQKYLEVVKNGKTHSTVLRVRKNAKRKHGRLLPVLQLRWTKSIRLFGLLKKAETKL